MEDFYHSRSDANRALSRTWKRELKDVLLKKSLRVLMETEASLSKSFLLKWFRVSYLGLETLN